jgi:hypothetical protein
MVRNPRKRAKVVRARAKAAVVRAMTTTNDDDRKGKGKDVSSGKTGCPVQL